ncbi:MAG: flagellar basal body P-ring formation protein FlgA [Bryobacteraceae bacterium]|nr:flagellar basal body P-ring formation protein FlgA [Bryobacteraceae bacterium]
MRRLAALAAAAALAWAARADACVVVEGDRILAADLAREAPLFAALDPGLPLAMSPAPGVRRVMNSTELRQLARRHNLPEVSVEPVCFLQAVETLSDARLIEALRNALDAPKAVIEIVDFPRFALPRGRLEFRLSGLTAVGAGAPADAPLLWRGAIRYGQRRSAPIWARVRIRIPRRQVVAARDIGLGRPLAVDDLALQEVEGPPLAEAPLEALDEALGALPRRRIRTGEPVFASMLRAPNDVQVGDLVRVEVRNGGARLYFEGRAETGGRRGAPVYVRNPLSGRRFPATVLGKGNVAVHLETRRNQ